MEAASNARKMHINTHTHTYIYIHINTHLYGNDDDEVGKIRRKLIMKITTNDSTDDALDDDNGMRLRW